MSKKGIPFRLNREDARPLVDQLADGLRSAILSGYWKSGEYLPGRDELAETLGVSVCVPRGAFRKLAAEGLLKSRPRLGCQVMDLDQRSWRGHVLLAQRQSDGSYYFSRFYDELQSGLLAAGYMVTRVVLGKARDSGKTREQLSVRLSRRFDLVFADTPSAAVREKAMATGSPLVSLVFGESQSPDAGGTRVVIDREGAMPSLLRHCRRCRVKTLAVIGFGMTRRMKAWAEFSEAGLTVDFREAEISDRMTLADIERLGYSLTDGLFAEGRCPDLMLFMDDFLARGGIFALSHRLPASSDWPIVVSWTNEGFEPFSPQPLTRMAMDPAGDAAATARHLLKVLAGRKVSRDLVLAPSYVIGKDSALGTRF